MLKLIYRYCYSSILSGSLICLLFCSVKEQHYQCGIEMIRRDLLTGHWKPYLLRAITLQPCYDSPINGGEVVPTIPRHNLLNFIWHDNLSIIFTLQFVLRNVTHAKIMLFFYKLGSSNPYPKVCRCACDSLIILYSFLV